MTKRILIGLGIAAVSLSLLGFAASTNLADFQQRFDRLSLKGHERVLQYGGSAYEVSFLADKLPKGEVVAMATPEAKPMLQNVHYVSNFENEAPFDRVILDEVITKKYKQQTLIVNLKDKLSPNGKMVLNIPDYKRGIIARAMVDAWLELADFNVASPKYLSYNVKQYQRILTKSGMQVSAKGWHKQSKRFDSSVAFKQWLQENWVYCQDMPSEDRELFVSAFADNYLKLTKQEGLDSVEWEQPYVSIEATVA